MIAAGKLKKQDAFQMNLPHSLSAKVIQSQIIAITIPAKRTTHRLHFTAGLNLENPIIATINIFAK